MSVPAMTDAIVVCLGLLLIARALQDAFKVVLLPKSARSRARTIRLFYLWSWSGWVWFAGRFREPRRRANVLAVYGPLSTVLLFASWMTLLVVGFGLLQWAVAPGSVQDWAGLRNAILLSADMFFTLGSIAAEMQRPESHALAVFEAGLGFGFIALTVGYLPVLYSGYSAREAYLLRFRVRAAPHWSAHDMLRFYAEDRSDILARWLRDAEIWIAETMVSHHSYPMLAFYRSQHIELSWLAALATTLDVCSIVRAVHAGGINVQPMATYAAGINLLVDLNASLGLAGPHFEPREQFESDAIPDLLAGLEYPQNRSSPADLAAEIERLRSIYEPELCRLSEYLALPLPGLASREAEEAIRAGQKTGAPLPSRSSAR